MFEGRFDATSRSKPVGETSSVMLAYNCELPFMEAKSAFFYAHPLKRERKAAKARNPVLDVNARSETEVAFYAAEANCILLVPHLSYLEEEMNERIAGTKAKVMVMSKAYDSTLDGDAAIDDLMKQFHSVSMGEQLFAPGQERPSREERL